MRNLLALLVAIVFLGGAWYYMEEVDGRGWQAVFRSGPTEASGDSVASHEPSVESDLIPEPLNEEQFEIPESVVLIDLQGRGINCKIVTYNADSIEVVRIPDEAKFTIQLDALNADSRAQAEKLRSTFLNANPAVAKANQWEQAKDAVEVILLVTEHTSNMAELKALLTQEDILFRFYDVEKSSRGRDYNKDVRLTNGHAFLVGDKILRMADVGTLKTAIMEEYSRQVAEEKNM